MRSFHTWMLSQTLSMDYELKELKRQNVVVVLYKRLNKYASQVMKIVNLLNYLEDSASALPLPVL